MHTDPLSAARIPDSNDSANVAQYFDNAVRDLSPLGNLVFTTTTARDTAFSNWVAAGNTMREGLRCHTTSDHSNWYYDGTTWTWPREPQGEKGRADYTNSGGVSLANTDTGLPAFAVTTSFIPSGRRIRLTFLALVSSDTAGTAYAFKIWKGPVTSGTFLRQIGVHAALATAGVSVNGAITYNTTSNLTNQAWNISGLRNSASGTFSLFGDSASGACQFIVEDVGAV